MILVPATGREEPENEKMSELDQEMSAILKNPKLSTKEKVEMYNADYEYVCPMCGKRETRLIVSQSTPKNVFYPAVHMIELDPNLSKEDKLYVYNLFHDISSYTGINLRKVSADNLIVIKNSFIF